MFGGLAFLVNGNMSVVVSGHGGLMVRVPADDTDTLSPSHGKADITHCNRLPEPPRKLFSL